MKLNELDLSAQKSVLKKIEELKSSDGWEILRQIMASEREDFFRKLAGPATPITNEVYHYNRGLIEAAYRFTDLPQNIIDQLVTAIRIKESTQAAVLNSTAP